MLYLIIFAVVVFYLLVLFPLGFMLLANGDEHEARADFYKAQTAAFHNGVEDGKKLVEALRRQAAASHPESSGGIGPLN